jgi:hypothetical protein
LPLLHDVMLLKKTQEALCSIQVRCHKTNLQTPSRPQSIPQEAVKSFCLLGGREELECEHSHYYNPSCYLCDSAPREVRSRAGKLTTSNLAGYVAGSSGFNRKPLIVP